MQSDGALLVQRWLGLSGVTLSTSSCQRIHVSIRGTQDMKKMDEDIAGKKADITAAEKEAERLRKDCKKVQDEQRSLQTKCGSLLSACVCPAQALPCMTTCLSHLPRPAKPLGCQLERSWLAFCSCKSPCCSTILQPAVALVGLVPGWPSCSILASGATCAPRQAACAGKRGQSRTWSGRSVCCRARSVPRATWMSSQSSSARLTG